MSSALLQPVSPRTRMRAPGNSLLSFCRSLADMDQAEGCAVRGTRGVLHKARNAVDGDEDGQVRNVAVVAVEVGLILIAVQRYGRAVHIDDDAVFVAALFEDSDGFILRELDEIHDGSSDLFRPGRLCAGHRSF